MYYGIYYIYALNPLRTKKEIHRIREILVSMLAGNSIHRHKHRWKIGNRVLKIDKRVLRILVIQRLLYQQVHVCTGGLIGVKIIGVLVRIPCITFYHFNTVLPVLGQFQTYLKIADCFTGEPESHIV